MVMLGVTQREAGRLDRGWAGTWTGKCLGSWATEMRALDSLVLRVPGE